ncbi:MAG: DUF808 domain-containing protein [Polyangiales bacterium]
MAGSSLLALIDDIATLLDDVSVLTKVAAKKTAGVLGDDLALNAQQVTGVRAHRELPVVWAVAKGSLRNKAILVPVALLISTFAPWLVTPLLMVGGAFLCFEGAEKLAHGLFNSGESDEEQAQRRAARLNPDVDVVALERQQVKGAIRTDFVLSAEIIAITLGEVADAEQMTRIVVLTGIALLMTVGVYGVVAAIVRLDDAGLYLCRRSEGGTGFGARGVHALGGALLRVTPYLMRTLSIAGTVAMFLVGGGILTHGIPPAHHAIEASAHALGELPGIGPVLHTLVPMVLQVVIGLITGLIVVGVVALIQKLRGKSASH